MFTTRAPRRALWTVLAALLLGLSFWRFGPSSARTASADDTDPEAYWSIGKVDRSGYEFAVGSAPEVTYRVGISQPGRDWRARQEIGGVCRILFTLERQPAESPLLEIRGFARGLAPEALAVTVNGKRGRFRVHPVAVRDLDEEDANSLIFSATDFDVPLDRGYLHAGENELALRLEGEGGSLSYDAVRLKRQGGDGPAWEARVEPTIFYRRRGEGLVELTDVVVRHRAPLASLAARLRVGVSVVEGVAEDPSSDFGERVMTLAVPAISAPAPYRLEVRAGGETREFTGEFTPQKRWRIFAGLKIHNDIGYTDLQPHVEELDGRNIDELLTLLPKFPFYRFNLETGWLVDNYLLSREAARRQQLLAALRGGRVSVNSMYLNLLTGLCTGEELYRSLYFSKELERRHGIPFGAACLTDAPSHTWSLPSLLADAGIQGFALGSNQSRAPLLQNSNLNEDSPFYWEGPDGRRVLAWFARSYLQLSRLMGRQSSADRLRRGVAQMLARYQRAGYPVDAVLLYGLYTDNADLAGGEAKVLADWRAQYAYPSIEPATDTDYFRYISSRFAEKLPVYRGDGGAYWEDGAGSTAAETAMNRDTQRLLPVVEMAASAATLFDSQLRYPAADLQAAWRDLLFYDEHTWGAFNSISQPGRRFVEDQWLFKRAYAVHARDAALKLYYRSFNRLAQFVSVDGPALLVFNPAGRTRTDLAEAELNLRQHLVDKATGKPVPVEVAFERDGWRKVRFLAENVPALGYRAYSIRPDAPPERTAPPASRSSWELDGVFYQIVADPRSGAVTRLFDKELQRDLAAHGTGYGLNELLYVRGGAKSRIERDMAHLPPAQLEVTGQTGAELVENVRTPLGQRLRIRARAAAFPEIETEIRIYDRLKRVDFVNRVRKEETRDKEAVYFAFPFALEAPTLFYELQSAWARPDQDQLPGACRDWFTTQNGVAARDRGAVVVWTTPDAPLITLGDINRGHWLKQLDVRRAHVFSYAMNNYWFTNYRAAQGGEFTFRYSVTSGRDLTEADWSRFSADSRSPLVAYAHDHSATTRVVPARKALPEGEASFVEVDSDHAEVTALKKAEDGRGLILRLRETAGRAGVARLRSPALRLTAAALTSGVEADRAPLAVKEGWVEAPLTPRQFTTVRLMLAAREKDSR
jgi:hypothetical protein